MSIVSLYPHIKETHKSDTVPLHELCEAMRTDYWRPKIEHLRVRIKEGASKEEIEALKSKLPYFTASGTFKTRNESGLLNHSGKIALDFDKLEDVEATRKVLEGDKYSEYVFSSCTGRGLCVIANIDSSKHLDSFLFLEKYYKTAYNLEIDKSCKDVSRPRYISWDEKLFYNPHYQRVALKTFDANSTTVDGDDEKFEWVKSVVEKKEKYVEGNRHHYMVVMGYFLNKCGVSQEYALNRFLSDYLGDGKDEKEIRRIIRDCYLNTDVHGTFKINKKVQDLPPEFQKGVKEVFKFAHTSNRSGVIYTKDTINQMCKAHLLAFDIVEGIFKSVYDKNKDYFNYDDQPEIYKIELFIKKKFEIVKNEVSQRYEYRPTGSVEPFQKLNTDTIYRDLQYAKESFKFSLDKLKSLLRSDYIPIYNPFKIYFDSLHKWEADEADYISDLADFIQTDNQEFWKIQFKKALVRSIACSLDHRENRIIITLVGQAQETGKSNFIRFLCPPFLKDYYTEAAMDGGKDSDMQLSENFIWNLEELAALHNNEVNKLKAIISKSNVKQRRAYAEFHDSNPRRVNFWASTNKAEFLTDDQNTRWICFNVVSINHDYNNFRTGVKKIDINNVWAQAYELYKTGFDYNLTPAEAAQRDAINKIYELSSIEKDLILEYYKPCEANKGEFMTCTDILMKIEAKKEHKIKLNIRAVGKAMRQLDFTEGFKKINGKTQRGYWMGSVDALFAPPLITYSETTAEAAKKKLF